MPPPAPPRPLGTHCSAVYNSTLYTYSSTAFYQLPLSAEGKWRELPYSISTDGGVCVHAHRGTDDEALYIIGGRTIDPSKTPETGFSGVQKWSFKKGRWTTPQLPDTSVFNLQNHGATYLEETGQILIFSGTKWPDTSTPSSMTFLIDTKPDRNWEIVAQSGEKAFPLLAPLVLPWGTAGALVVGGDTNNRNMYTYTLADGWNTLDVQLEEGLPVRGKAAAALLQGKDGSRVLITYDMTVSPAKVREVLVKGGNGSKPKHRKRHSSISSRITGNANVLDLTRRGLRKRIHQTTPIPVIDSWQEGSWPKYDDKLAPKELRDGFSIAQEENLVVVSGGDEVDPLCIFDARRNAWMNATALLATRADQQVLDDGQIPIVGTLPDGSSPLKPIIDGPSSDPSAGAKKLSFIQVLFIVLGVVLFVALALFFVLIWLRRRRGKQSGPFLGGSWGRSGRFEASKDGSTASARAHKRKHSELPKNKRGEKSGRDSQLSFKDRGLSFMKETSMPLAHRPIPEPHYTTTHDSLNKEIGGLSVPSASHQERKERSSGWSRYFSGASKRSSNYSQDHSDTRSTVFPYRSGVSHISASDFPAPSPAPLNIQKQPVQPGIVRQQTDRTISQASFTSSDGSASLYEYALPHDPSTRNYYNAQPSPYGGNFDARSSLGSASEKPLWVREEETVRGGESPRGWGKVVQGGGYGGQEAVMQGGSGGQGRAQAGNDLSWLNLGRN
ncbi:hypothetical protein BJ508DRAFT_328940 [Ascobolus immersus RN42]|uniref:Galactose oxidase n=1 Tax=Ascobolus immersus RN42 TaxID=1160509 RepID=A0A3N4I273_ASCIM|nr:hypothetical protein BJ508DRAFT_328940 [Ascobolus immersus RN42]